MQNPAYRKSWHVEPPCHLNVNTLTVDAYGALAAADRALIGTVDYIGIAYFWAQEYKYPMRDCSFALCRRVHKALLDAGLAPDGVSSLHEMIIEQVTRSDRNFLRQVAKKYGTHHDFMEEQAKLRRLHKHTSPEEAHTQWCKDVNTLRKINEANARGDR